MYWNLAQSYITVSFMPLNSNIRCIEMQNAIDSINKNLQLNSNIRCIEIIYDKTSEEMITLLNSNIRCIEIEQSIPKPTKSRSWIVTLDVLKCDLESDDNIKYKLNSNIRCIEIFHICLIIMQAVSWIVTLDVLKCYWIWWNELLYWVE